jgi:LacI family transcriptional regulator
LLEPEGVTTRLSTEVLAIDDRQMAEVLRLIREHACDGIRVDALAQHVGMSRSVLQRRFRSLLHRSLHDEILHTRLRRARELLVRSDLSLAGVAERSGFKHQEYLGAVCKAHLGKTAAQVRKESRG